MTRSSAFSRLSLGFLVLMALALVPAHTAAGDARALIHQAAIADFTGKVDVQRGGAWFTAVKNAPLKSEDRVRTGAGATCRLIIGDIGMVELGEKTEARLGMLKQERDASVVRDIVVVHLERGTSRQILNRKPGRTGDFRVTTPIAVAAVRGTGFEMALNDALTGLGCTVREGTVELSGTVGGQTWSRSVTAGQALEVAANKIPAEPAAAPPASLQRLQPLATTVSQTEISLAPVPEPQAGEAALTVEPAELTFVTEGKVEQVFTGRTLVVNGAAAPKSVRISIAGTPVDADLVLENGKAFTISRKYESYPFSFEGSGKVSTTGKTTTITFDRLRIAYVEEAALDAYKLPCVLTLDPGGSVPFTLVITPGEEIEVE